MTTSDHGIILLCLKSEILAKERQDRLPISEQIGRRKKSINFGDRQSDGKSRALVRAVTFGVDRPAVSLDTVPRY
jgi:hypothetical protein